MRVVGGAQRGRPITAPRGQATRPTADRTRQALFNVLEHAPWSPGLAGRRVIDLFAGSGALGLEALSRGAAFCLFADREPAAREAIAKNLAALGLGDAAAIRPWDATRLPPRPGDLAAFDLVFLDPPYGRGLGERALASLLAGGWLGGGAVATLEQGAGDPAPASPGFDRLDDRAWGAARIWFLKAS